MRKKLEKIEEKLAKTEKKYGKIRINWLKNIKNWTKLRAIFLALFGIYSIFGNFRLSQPFLSLKRACSRFLCSPLP